LFSVAVRDLERQDQNRSWTIPTEWLATAFEGTEATPEGAPGRLELYLKKSASEVLVKGKARAKVIVPCARTLEPLTFDLDADVLLLLTPRTPAVGLKRERTPSVAPKRERAPRGGERAERGTRQREAETREAELSSEEAARDHYEGETVVLDEFVREHLLLELPLFPVRSDLPSEEAGVTGSLPDPAGTDEPAELDPRLAPLAALRQGLMGQGVASKKK
jgi:uncharacterized protein